MCSNSLVPAVQRAALATVLHSSFFCVCLHFLTFANFVDTAQLVPLSHNADACDAIVHGDGVARFEYPLLRRVCCEMVDRHRATRSICTGSARCWHTRSTTTCSRCRRCRASVATLQTNTQVARKQRTENETERAADLAVAARLREDVERHRLRIGQKPFILVAPRNSEALLLLLLCCLDSCAVRCRR